MTDRTPIQHYSYWCETPYVTCTGYLLPGLIPPEVKADLHPSLRDFTGTEGVAAHALPAHSAGPPVRASVGLAPAGYDP